MAEELKNALEKAAEEQPDGALSARVKKLLARKKNLQRKKEQNYHQSLESEQEVSS